MVLIWPEPCIIRVGQNRTYEYLAYLDTPYNRTRMWKFPTISVYPYDRTWILADRIYTPYVRSNPYLDAVYGPFLQVVQGSIPTTAVFLLFLVNFLFSRLFLLSSSFPFLFIAWFLPEGGHWAKAKTCSFLHERCNYSLVTSSNWTQLSFILMLTL